MEIKYIIISVIILSLFYGAYYLYIKKYDTYINQVLKQNHFKKMISPTRLMFIIILSFSIFTLLLNIIPFFQPLGIDLEGKVQQNVITSVQKDYNDPNYKEYDFKKLDYGYVIAYNNDQMSCYGTPGDTCIGTYHTSASKISYYDENDELIWTIGGNFAADDNIRYEHYQFQAWAIDQLENGNFVSFGRYVDLDTELFSIGLLVIDRYGSIINLIDIDIRDYDVDGYGGFYYFDLLSTDDGGFVLKYLDSFFGSFVLKFDAYLNVEWSYLYNDRDTSGYFVGLPLDKYSQTMFYSENKYYIVRDQLVVCLNEEGSVQWEYTSDLYLFTGVQMIENDIYVYGSTYEEFMMMDDLLHTYDAPARSKIIYLERINKEDGALDSRVNFDYYRLYQGYYSYSFSPRYLYIDDEGMLNLVLIGHQNYDLLDLEFYMYIIRFDDKNDYQGFAVMDGKFISYDAEDNFTENMNKLTVVQNDDYLVLYSPLSSHFQVNLDLIEFDKSVSNNFYNQLYTFYINSRIILNNLLLSTYISIVVFFIVSMIILDNKHQKLVYIEKDGSDFWNEVYESQDKKE